MADAKDAKDQKIQKVDIRFDPKFKNMPLGSKMISIADQVVAKIYGRGKKMGGVLQGILGTAQQVRTNDLKGQFITIYIPLQVKANAKCQEMLSNTRNVVEHAKKSMKQHTFNIQIVFVE